MAASEILAAAAQGDIDLNAIARQELANRGQNWQGQWIGFEKAAALAAMVPVRGRNGRLMAVSVPE